MHATSNHTPPQLTTPIRGPNHSQPAETPNSTPQISNNNPTPTQQSCQSFNPAHPGSVNSTILSPTPRTPSTTNPHIHADPKNSSQTSTHKCSKITAHLRNQRNQRFSQPPRQNPSPSSNPKNPRPKTSKIILPLNCRCIGKIRQDFHATNHPNRPPKTAPLT